MQIIRKEQLESALSKNYRQYLAGHLKTPQPDLQHIDDDIEVGMSLYESFTADKPHVHPVCTEHGYVIEGAVRILLLDGSNKSYEANQGDFFAIKPGIPYASKNRAGTHVLFIKSPAMNDKTLIDIDENTKNWLASWDE